MNREKLIEQIVDELIDSGFVDERNWTDFQYEKKKCCELIADHLKDYALAPKNLII